MAVPWDSVVHDKHFWSEPARPDIAVGGGSPACVQVWLFGSLADAVEERPITLQLNSPFTIDEVIAELGRRCGAGLLGRITTPEGVKNRNCRVFVNGEPVADPALRIHAEAVPAQVELIVLSALEGG